ncbi:hypothetical protein ACMY46_06230 [Bartonella bacilliformis]|uniref:hypothetical protein n=1 Tax=Bartonella bacilliformis TaxID=774 RepID=UPI00049EE9A8|nr:hypothetical protein [Bartonella bacilliformis]KEG17061.1 hypothetical protein H705_00954 [Bartonella bacilliformis Cond044]
MFNPVLKLFFGMLFFAFVMLAAFGLMKSAVFKAEKARDLYWQFEIAKVSAKAQLEQILQMQAAQTAELRAQKAILALEQELIKMEEANVALPVARCGIGIERVRLLNTQARK